MFKNLNLRFYLIMIIFIGIIIPIYREDFVGIILAPVANTTARIVHILIHWAGLEAGRNSNLIFHPNGFIYEISFRCIGFLPIIFFVAAVFAHSIALRTKLYGLALGIPILLLINLVRLVHLFYLGVYEPGQFSLAHSVLWQMIIIFSTIGLWLALTIWDRRITRVQMERHLVRN